VTVLKAAEFRFVGRGECARHLRANGITRYNGTPIGRGRGVHIFRFHQHFDLIRRQADPNRENAQYAFDTAMPCFRVRIRGVDLPTSKGCDRNRFGSLDGGFLRAVHLEGKRIFAISYSECALGRGANGSPPKVSGKVRQNAF